MAINKRKMLQSAQKHMQKGALDKALKDYQALLQVDPRDVNVRLKIGDICLKMGNTSEAVNAYGKVADRFMADGFDAKAVALYKQITKIDPERFDVQIPLAELYQRLGLTSDAMRALQTAADAHYREGNKDDSLDLLRKMAALDPSNTANRLKVADLLRQQDRMVEALSEFEEVADELERQGDREEWLRVLEKIVELDPQRTEALVAIARGQLASGRTGAAEDSARKLVETHPQEPTGWELLAETLEQSGREEETVEAWRKLAEVYKARGDVDSARDIMQRHVATDALAGDDGSEPVLESDADLGFDAFDADGSPGQQAADATIAFGAGLDVSSPGADATVVDLGSGAGADATVIDLGAATGGVPTAPAPVEDPEQVLAEAGVYIRYGKHERAIESLEGLLASQPEHAGALAGLGAAHASAGSHAEALDAYRRAAASARLQQDPEIFAAVVAGVTEIDPAAAAALGPPPSASPCDSLEASPESSEPPSAVDELVLEDVEIEIDAGLDEEPAEAAQEAPSEETTPDEELLLDEDPDLDGEELEDIEFPDSEVSESPEEIELSEISDEIELVTEETELQEPASDAAQEEQDAAQDSATTSQQLLEDLEEAEFYFEQGLFDDAKAAYERILTLAPNHPQVMLRLGEIEAEKSDADDSEAAAAADAPMALGTLTDVETDSSGGAHVAAERASGTEADLLSEDRGLDLSQPLDEPPELDTEASESPEPLEGVATDGGPGPLGALLDFEVSSDEFPLDLAFETDEDESANAAPDASSAETEGSDPAPEALADDAFDVSAEDLPLDMDEGEMDLGAADAAVELSAEHFDAPGLEDGPAFSSDSDLEGELEDALEDDPEDTLEDTLELDEVSTQDTGNDSGADLDAAFAATDATADGEDLVSVDDEEPDGPAEEPELASEAEDDESGAPAAEAGASTDEVVAGADEVETAPAPASLAEITTPNLGEFEGGEETLPGGPGAPGDAAQAPGDFDLAAALSAAIDPNESASVSKERGGTTEEEGFEQVFSAFKSGVAQELDDGDHEAHYDLGIAYREMGLFDDAVDEFRKALGAPDRELSGLHMMGLCALDLGQLAQAEEHLERALSLADVPAEQQVGIRYDLGRVLTERGQPVRARVCFQAVLDTDPGFADAAERLAELPEAEEVASEKGDTAEDGFEALDDLMEDSTDEPAQEEAEPAYESFEEFLDEDDEESPDDHQDSGGAAEPAEAPEPVEPDPERDPDSGPEKKPRKKKRRRKISFF